MSPDQPARTKRTPVDFVMTALVLCTLFAAVRGFVTVESGLLKALDAAWIVLGIAILWARWRPRR